MKKTYIIPATKTESAVVEQMLANSITRISGDSGLELGNGEAPGDADVKEFDDEGWDW
jgi:hypothetical protein